MKIHEIIVLENSSIRDRKEALDELSKKGWQVVSFSVNYAPLAQSVHEYLLEKDS